MKKTIKKGNVTIAQMAGKLMQSAGECMLFIGFAGLLPKGTPKKFVYHRPMAK